MLSRYDDIWDRSYYPKGSNCTWPAGGPIGAESKRSFSRYNVKLLISSSVEYDETDDYNLNLLFSGGIDPANLPEAKINGKCQPLYPHERVRVNTLFEVAVAAGKKTAYADKHPSYDIVREFASRPKRSCSRAYSPFISPGHFVYEVFSSRAYRHFQSITTESLQAMNLC
jgi:hypothetical protein